MSTNERSKNAAGGGTMQVPGLLVLLAGAAAAFLFRQEAGPAASASPTESTWTAPCAEPAVAASDAAPTRLLGYVEGVPEVGVAARPSARTAGQIDMVAAWTEVASSPVSLPATMPPFQDVRTAASPPPVRTAQGLNPPLARMRPFAGPTTSATSDAMSSTPANVPRRHVVRDGDTLGGLAERYYGDPRRYTEIFAANRGVLSSPELLPIGVELAIPGFDAATAPFGPVAPPAARLVPHILLRNP